MKILRLYIQHCGVFHQTLIDFTHEGIAQDVLCIAGVNGSGKTTVIELIFNLIALLNPQLSLQDFSYDRLKANILTRVEFSQLDIEIDNKIISLVIGSAEKIQKTNSDKQVFIIESDLKPLISQYENSVIKTPENEDESDIILRVKEFKANKDFSERVVDKKNSEIIQPLIDDIEKSLSIKNGQKDNKSLPSVYFFNAHDREIRDIRYNSIPNEKLKYQLTHKYHPRNDDLKKTLVYYDYAYQEKFEQLKDWLNKYILVGKSIEKIDRPNFNVVIKTNQGSTHGLELLSSGEESLLIIATQLYLRARENAVFIIDEIDQSLHPEFQEKIISTIKLLQKEKSCQVIVSSHSDIIWKNFKDKGLIDLTETVLL